MSTGTQVIHFYYSKNYGRNEIKILCTNDWIKAEPVTKSWFCKYRQKDIVHCSGGWTIEGVRQTSVLENITCPKCLEKSLPIFRRKHSKYLIKIEQILREKV